MAEKTSTVKSAAKEETAVKAAASAAEKKAPEKKEEVKKEEVKKEEKAPVKKETKAAAKKTTAKKPAVKKTTTKKAAEKTEEKPVTQRAAKKAAAPVVHLQFSNKAYSIEDLQKIANDVWKFDLHNEEDYTSLELYVKPEESVAYYVFNGDITGHFFIQKKYGLFYAVLADIQKQKRY